MSFDVYRCDSPKLAGLKFVNLAMCGGCHYRNHESDRPATPPIQILACLHRGRVLSSSATGQNPEYECHHSDHQRTTDSHCRTCPDYFFPVVTPNTPPDVVRQALDLPPHPQSPEWAKWPNVQEGLRLATDVAIRLLPEYPDTHDGRGIVIVGGGKYFASMYVTIRILRHVGCRLPIEVWHFAEEMTDAMRNLLIAYNVMTIDADQYVSSQPYRFLHGHRWKGWQLKPYAIVHSRFREVLYLDADCYPVRNPEFLFDWPPYQERGATFWPDLSTSAYLLPRDRWNVFGAKPGWLPLESGQMLINKQARWQELQLALWYNARADLVYHLLWGDKDTFNIAWRRLGTHYSMPQPTSDWDAPAILQYGPDGEVLFQHRCQDKFRLEGARFTGIDQPHATNTYNPRLALEDVCFGFLDELRAMNWMTDEPH